MPELPEVEVVRRGLAEHLTGRRIASVHITGPRVARRHLPGPADLATRVTGAEVRAVCRRGKYLWLHLDGGAGGEQALLVHLGMSGQLLIEPPDAPQRRHMHARMTFADGGPQLRFVDQRTFGAMALSRLRADGIPDAIAHIAPDPMDEAFEPAAVAARLKARRSAVKRGLLEQTLVSGIGNIYADEALWGAGIHGERLSSALTRPALARLLGHALEVMTLALDHGGTSFDALYVNVNGASGSFDRSLAVYGQAGRPCRRCGTAIRREPFANRSSYSCPRCQPRPRYAARPGLDATAGRPALA
ncbi:MAG: bifunctional DNA-formamidopyrimidine glycosylase/DNA-(apurinic or apyrimidinic site) lyase [Dermatophilaceae bacterium]